MVYKIKKRGLLIVISMVLVASVVYAAYQPQKTAKRDETLERILTELKIMNIHLREVTGQNFKETDIEEGGKK